MLGQAQGHAVSVQPAVYGQSGCSGSRRSGWVAECPMARLAELEFLTMRGEISTEVV